MPHKWYTKDQGAKLQDTMEVLFVHKHKHRYAGEFSIKEVKSSDTKKDDFTKDKSIGNFVESFKEPINNEAGEIILSNKFPYKPLKKNKLTTAQHFVDKMRGRNINMEEVSEILNNSNQGFQAKMGRIFVKEIKGKFSYVIIDSDNTLITIKNNATSLPKGLRAQLW